MSKTYVVEVLSSIDKSNWFVTNITVDGSDPEDAKVQAAAKFLNDFENTNNKKFSGYIETSVAQLRG